MDITNQIKYKILRSHRKQYKKMAKTSRNAVFIKLACLLQKYQLTNYGGRILIWQ